MTDYATLSAPDLITQAMASDDEAMRDAAFARIDEHTSTVKRLLDAGAGPDEYKLMEQVHQALVLSQKTMPIAWNNLKTLRQMEGN